MTVQGHIASKWQSWDLNPGLCALHCNYFGSLVGFCVPGKQGLLLILLRVICKNPIQRLSTG